MDRILLVGCGGFIGAVLRYLVSLGTQRLLGTPLNAKDKRFVVQRRGAGTPISCCKYTWGST